MGSRLCRCRHRCDSLIDRKPLKPDKVYPVTVDISHAAAMILPRHLLCIQIQGSHCPVCDRKTNTGDKPFRDKTLIVTQTLYHDPERPSGVLLPIVSTSP